MRTLEHWDDCNIQIKFEKGENDRQVLVKIVDEYSGSVAGQSVILHKWGTVGTKSGWNFVQTIIPLN